jgi:hypothetical protein
VIEARVSDGGTRIEMTSYRSTAQVISFVTVTCLLFSFCWTHTQM